MASLVLKAMMVAGMVLVLLVSNNMATKRYQFLPDLGAAVVKAPVVDLPTTSSITPSVSYVTNIWAEQQGSSAEEQGEIVVGSPVTRRRLGKKKKENKILHRYPIEAAASPDTRKNHRYEIEAALAANLCNIHFGQVVIILDSVSKESNCTHFPKKILDLRDQVLASALGNNTKTTIQELPILTCIDRQQGQPTYLEMFNYTFSPLVRGDTVVMGNPDHVYDETLKWAAHVPNNMIWVLSTTGWGDKPVTQNPYKRRRTGPVVTGEATPMPLLVQQAYNTLVKEVVGNRKANKTRPTTWCNSWLKFSWDTYVYRKDTFGSNAEHFITSGNNFRRPARNNPLEYKQYYMNVMGAESNALVDLKKGLHNVTVVNACPLIHSWHFHWFQKMHGGGAADDAEVVILKEDRVEPRYCNDPTDCISSVN